jgi:DNA-binding NarL/FixJ family response regulator
VDGADAVSRTQRLRPDIVMMDIRMPRLDGLAATRQLRDLAGVEVIIVTTFDLDEYVLEALRAGAVGFLLKDTQPERIIDAARAVARGRCPHRPRRHPTPARAVRPDIAVPAGRHAPERVDAPGT